MPEKDEPLGMSIAIGILLAFEFCVFLYILYKQMELATAVLP